MIKNLGLQGSVGPVDFYSYVSGANARNSYFYEETSKQIRFFSKGIEFIISEDGVKYSGTGGNFCEYMFGVDKPLKDIIVKEVRNRLIMFGAFLDDDEKVVFTNKTGGGETFKMLFFLGHAVRNYYFFVSSDFKGPQKDRQKQILGAVGKLLKRTDHVVEGNDPELSSELLNVINEPETVLLMFKLLHKGNEEYYRAFSGFYMKDRTISQKDEEALQEISRRHGIDFYQQERMKIDIMYRHPDNMGIVDEYRDILVAGVGTEIFKGSELARLRRLRTLRVRHNIPSVLFETHDEFLLRGKKIQETAEPEYLTEARSIMQNLFFEDQTLKGHLINEDIVRLIMAKHSAYTDGERGFEQLLLDVGKACDEAARERKDFSLLEDFSSIVTYFDRYDHVQSSMSRIAFMQNMEFSDDFLRSLLGNIKEFDELEPGLFRKTFISGLLGNKFIGYYGRAKVQTLTKGLERVALDDASLKDVKDALASVAREEALYNALHDILKRTLGTYYAQLDRRNVREKLREEAEKRLHEEGFKDEFNDAVFERVLMDLKKEFLYVSSLLPAIIKDADGDLREDFLLNSGLDRFQIENLEKEYFEEHGLDSFLLNLIRGDAEEAERGSHGDFSA